MPPNPDVDKGPAIRSEALLNTSVNANWSSNDVWIQGKDEAFVAAKIVKKKGNKVVVQLKDNKMLEVNAVDVARMNPPDMDGVDDMINLTHLNEASLVHNLQYRYNDGQIYTNSGLFLVAVNPYRELPIYDNSYIEMYRMGNPKYFKPHIFAVAESCYREMSENNVNLSILITGESGAGKTETTKKVIKYITAVACKRNKPDSLPDAKRKNNEFLHLLENNIMTSNTILEAFGNALTVKNDNSSRFGKSICIEFDSSQMVCGSSIKWYLLEKSRVTHTSPLERNYHVFYQFMKGADPKLKEKFYITGDISDYNILKDTKCSISGVDEAKEFRRLMASMDAIGFSQEESEGFIRLICAILHLGQVGFVEGHDGITKFDSPKSKKSCELACKVLGVSPEKFYDALLQPQITAGKDVVVQSVSPAQAKYSVESISRATYECLFAALVDLINKCMAPKHIAKNSMLVLDISGFEIVEKNSFEQLCINLSNEKLQQFFNHYYFIKEQEEYIKEGLEWNFIDFKQDLQPTIDLIEGKDGVFRCLDTLCFLQSSTDKKFLSELNSGCCKKSDKFLPSRFGTGFTIKHYAGDVKYEVDGWIDKNRDPVNIAALKCLAASSIKFVADIYSDCSSTKTQVLAPEDPRVPSLVKKGQFHSTSQIHREQLNTLMTTLNKTRPYFVRCLIPNREKRSDFFDTILISEQLKCNGVYGGIRTARSGFPSRIPFKTFASRYDILIGSHKISDAKSSREVCIKIIDFVKLSSDMYRIGNTKVLLRAGILAEIEEKKNIVVSKKVVIIQSCVRRWLALKKYKSMLQLEESATIIQNNIRAFLRLHRDPWSRLYVGMKPLLNIMEDEAETAEFMKEINKLEVSLAKEVAEKEKANELLNDSVKREKQILDSLDAANAELSTKRETILGLSEKVLALEEAAISLGSIKSENESLVSANAEIKQRLDSTIKECDTANNSLQAAVKKISALEESQNKLSEQLSQANSLNSRLSAELSAERGTLDKVNLEIYKYGNMINLIQVEKGKLIEENQLMSEEKKNLSTKLAEMSSELYDLKQEKQKADEEVSENKKDIEKLNERLCASEKENKSLSLELKNANDLLTGANAKLKSSLRDNEQLEEKIKALNAHIELKCTAESRQSDLVSMREVEITELNGKIADMKKEYSDFKKKSVENYQALEAKNEEARRSMEKLKETILSLEDSKEKKEARLSSVSKDKADLESKVESLNKSLAKTSGELASSKSEMEKLKSENAELSNLLKEKTAEACNAVCNVKRLSDKCGLLENEIVKSDSSNIGLKSELSSMTSKIKLLSDELEAQSLHSKQLEKDLDFAKKMYDDDVSKKVVEAENYVRSAEDELKKLKSTVNILTKENNRLTNDSEDLIKRNEILSGEIEDLKVYVNRNEQMIGNLNQTIADNKVKYDLVLKEREIEATKGHKLAEEVEGLKMSLDEAAATIKQQSVLIKSHEDERSEYNTRLDSIINQLSDNGRNINSLEESNARMSKEVSKYKADISCLEESLKRANEELAAAKIDFEGKIQKEKMRLTSAENDYSVLKELYASDIEDLQKNSNDLERELQRLKLVNAHMSERISEYEKAVPGSGGDTSSLYSGIKQTYENRVAKLIDKITEANKKENEGREKNIKLENRVKALTSELESAAQERDLYEKECKELKQQEKSLKEKVSKLTSEIRVLGDSNERYILEANNLSMKLKGAEEKLRNFSNAAIDTQSEPTAEELKKLKETLEEHRNRETALLLKIKHLGDAIRDKNISYKILSDKCELLLKNLANANSDLDKERAEVANCKSAIDDSNAERDRLQDELKSANSFIEANNNIIDTLNKKIKSLTDRVTSAESSLKALRSDNSQQMMVASLELRNKNLEHMLQDKKAEIEKYVSELEFMSKCEIDGLNKIDDLTRQKIDLSADIERLVSEYEGKLSDLQAKLTETEIDAKREKEKLENMVGMERSVIESHRSQLSKYVAECQSIKAMLSELQRERDDLLSQNANLTKSSQKLDSKCLDLGKSIANLKSCLVDLSNSNSELRSRSLAQDKTIEEYKQKEAQLLTHRDEYMTEVEKLKSDLETLRESSASLKKERDRAADDANNLRLKISRLTDEISTKEMECSSLKNSLNELTAKFNNESMERMAYEREISRLNIDIENITKSSDKPMKSLIDSMNKIIDEKTSTISSMKDNVFRLENEIRSHKQSAMELRSNLDLERKTTAEVRNNVAGLEAKVKAHKADVVALKDQLSKRELEVRDLHSKLEDLNEKILLSRGEL